MKVQSSSSHALEQGIKVLISGPPGVGKTRSAASLKAAGYKPIIISAESGLLSLREENIPVIDIAKDDEGKDIPISDRVLKFDANKKVCGGRLWDVFNWLKKGQKEYDTVFVDSLTEINQSLMAHLNVKYPDRKDSLPKYGDNSEIMLKLVREFRDLPYNVVVISLSEVEKDDVGRRFTTASVIGKVSTHLPALFDLVFHLNYAEDEQKNSVPRFQCRGTSEIVCKDRSGALATYEKYNLGEIFNKIRGPNVGSSAKP